MSAEQRIDLAALLVEAGAGASARAVLGALRGAAANRLRARSDAVSLRAGVFALTALQSLEGDGAEPTGVALPVAAEPGEPRVQDREAREACVRARAVVRSLLGLDGEAATAVRLGGDARFSVEGPSLGLGAALAFALHWMPSRAPRVAVLATGALGDDGSVRAVGHLREKCAAAGRERGERVLLVPACTDGSGRVPLERAGDRFEVRTIDEAFFRAFGPGPYEPDARVLRFEDRLARACAETNMPRAEALLRALLEGGDLLGGDRARVALELGTRLRHLGRTDEALALHRAVRSKLRDPELRGLIGAEAAERYELECCATEMDDFALDAVTDALRARVERPFLLTRNELRCRGMLAQARGMAGAFSEAVRLREQNLSLHARSESLREVLPGTHCWAALDAARAGDPERFERHARALAQTRRPGDTQQGRYDGACVLRGLVALGRDREALRWAYGELECCGGAAPEPLRALARGLDPVTTHPEVSALRALVRAHRRVGEHARAHALADRARPEGGPLVAWLALLVALERALATRASGDEESASRERARAWSALRAAHPSASAFHQQQQRCRDGGLFSEQWAVMDRALEDVWY